VSNDTSDFQSFFVILCENKIDSFSFIDVFYKKERLFCQTVILLAWKRLLVVFIRKEQVFGIIIARKI
jgi:hypothetical protein